MADGDAAVQSAARRLRLTPVFVLSAGICFGIAIILTVLVVFNLVQELHDARQDIEANRVENQCRAENTARLNVLDSEISYNGWLGLTAWAEGDREEMRRRAELIRQLGVERDIAVDNRLNVVALCDNGTDP